MNVTLLVVNSLFYGRKRFFYMAHPSHHSFPSRSCSSYLFV